MQIPEFDPQKCWYHPGGPWSIPGSVLPSTTGPPTTHHLVNCAASEQYCLV